MIAALMDVANVLVVFTSIVFQFWKKLFAVVMSPAVVLATVDQESVLTPSVLRYCPVVPVPAEILGSVTEPSAGAISVPTSLMPIASHVSAAVNVPAARVMTVGDPPMVYRDVLCFTPFK
jgi:hypothetical protein